MRQFSVEFSVLGSQFSEKPSGGRDSPGSGKTPLLGGAAVHRCDKPSTLTPALAAAVYSLSRLAAMFIIAVAALLCAPAVAQDNPIALKGGKLLTITHGVIENGTVVMQGGKIAAVGPAGSVRV